MPTKSLHWRRFLSIHMCTSILFRFSFSHRLLYIGHRTVKLIVQRRGILGRQLSGSTSRISQQMRMEVNIEFCEIPVLNRSAFPNLPNCTKLNLGDDSISQIKDGAFLGLSNVKTLDLERNNLHAIRRGMWEGLDNLERLTVEWNHIDKIAENTFIGLTNLKKLEVGANDISVISPGAFNGLSNVEDLILWANELNTMSIRICSRV